MPITTPEHQLRSVKTYTRWPMPIAPSPTSPGVNVARQEILDGDFDSGEQAIKLLKRSYSYLLARNRRKMIQQDAGRAVVFLPRLIELGRAMRLTDAMGIEFSSRASRDEFLPSLAAETIRRETPGGSRFLEGVEL